MISARQVDALLPDTTGGVHWYQKEYDTQDIIDRVILADKHVAKYTSELSTLFSPDVKDLLNLFELLAKNIRYKKDRIKTQVVKSPALLWKDKKGDCKSFTVFITSVLQNIGVPYLIRFTSYSRVDKTKKHVYPVALIKGKEIPIDVVYYLQERGRFGTEKRYYHKFDHHMKEGLAFLTGTIGSVNATEEFLDALAELENTIPDSVLENDITQMTEGELQRKLMAERLRVVSGQLSGYTDNQNYLFAAKVLEAGDVARIGAVQGSLQGTVLRFIQKTKSLKSPAFIGPRLHIKIPPEASVSGFFQKVGKFFKKVGKGTVNGVKNVAKEIGKVAKKVWQKTMNWIFKGGLQKAGPFFLFAFLKSNTGRKEVDRRRGKQLGVIRFFEKLGMKKNNIEAAITNGVIKHVGATPDKVLNDSARGSVASPSLSGVAAAVISAVGWVIKIIQKLIGLFKKKEGDAIQVGASDTSDVKLLEGLADVARTGAEAIRNIRSKINPKENYGNTGVYYSPEYAQDLSQQPMSASSARGVGSGGLVVAAGITALYLFTNLR